jgi:hypothetical protein
MTRVALLLLMILGVVSSFQTPNPKSQILTPTTKIATSTPSYHPFPFVSNDIQNLPRSISQWAVVAGGLVSGAGSAMAADDLEIAELPPPYVPALLAVGLLAGIAVLTGSLGNVMDEEASLGMQSGARAKKEIERSRSSYFKK